MARQSTAKKERANKPTRVPVSGSRDIMTVFGKEEDFVYRWVNDINEAGSRILKFKRGGYEFARNELGSDEYVIGEEAVYQSKNDGSIIRLPVGTDKAGQAMHAYLMRIKKEWYDEDQDLKEKELQKEEEAIMRAVNDYVSAEDRKEMYLGNDTNLDTKELTSR